MKAYFIDAHERVITEVEWMGPRDLQRLIGGDIERHAELGNGDSLFVDEEGLMKPQTAFFRIGIEEQPLAGNGVVTGLEINDKHGEYVRTDPPTSSLEYWQGIVTFHDRAFADSWAKGNASEPAVSLVSFAHGRRILSAETIATMGQVFGQMPRPKDENA